MVGDRVALAGRAVAVDGDRALSVEVRCRFVAIQIGEHRRECLSSFEHVCRLAAFAVHVDREARVDREERLLALGVAPVGAVGVGVEQLAHREPVGGLGRSELGVDGHVLALGRPKSAAAVAWSCFSWPGVGHQFDSKLVVSQPARRAPAS